MSEKLLRLQFRTGSRMKLERKSKTRNQGWIETERERGGKEGKRDKERKRERTRTRPGRARPYIRSQFTNLLI